MTVTTLALPRTRSLPRDRLASWARSRVFRRFAQMEQGRLTIVEPSGTTVFGREHSEHSTTVRVHDPETWLRIALGGSLGAGEAYVDGLWESDELLTLVRMVIEESDRLSVLDGGSAQLVRAPVLRFAHDLLRRNDRRGARRNIAEHYDLGNDFYRLWLDPTMMYSSAIWEREDMGLEDAQVARLDRICQKLDLSPGDRLLEIGTGWGGLALHAASRYGAIVTTTTLSKEQHALALERVRRAGLEDRVTVLLEDYRDLAGSYDAVVSIEMIEAVGARYLETYFTKVCELLSPDGLALIQAITVPDDRYERSLRTVDFIKRHVFPGGQLPSLNAMSSAWSQRTDFRLLHYEDFGEHYARTLHLWRDRFLARLDRVREQGYSEEFIRLWDFYLAYCEGGFLERHVGVAQLLLARPKARRAPVVAPLREAV